MLTIPFFLTKMLRWLIKCDIVSVDVNFLCELYFLALCASAE